MASVKIYYNVQSCPKCGKKLLKVQSGTLRIGSPFLECKKCGNTYLTDLRVEWYKHPNKWTVFLIPMLIPVTMLIVGTIMEDLAIGVAASFFGLLFGICYMMPDVIRIFKSAKRMRDPDYLRRLRQANLISFEEYEAFSAKNK